MKRFFSTILAAALLFSLGVPAFAEVKPVISEKVAVLSPLYIVGEIDSIKEKQVTVTDSVKKETIILNVETETYVLDATTGEKLTRDLKQNESVAVYYGPATTRSIPAQSNAVVILANVTKDFKVPHYSIVESVEKCVIDKKDCVKVTTENNSIVLTILSDKPISQFATKNIVGINDLTVGSKILTWYDVVAMSLPAQATVNKTVILEKEVLPEKDIISLQAKNIFVKGEKLETNFKPPYMKDGMYMVPLRAIAESLGYKVTWLGKDGLIELENKEHKISIIIKNSELSVGRTDGMIGMYIDKLDTTLEISAGTTYVPATFFERNANCLVVSEY